MTRLEINDWIKQNITTEYNNQGFFIYDEQQLQPHGRTIKYYVDNYGCSIHDMFLLILPVE